MPELPEVETMRRGVLPIVGKRIVDVRFGAARFRPIRIEPSRAGLCRLVKNHRIVGVLRLGKRLVFQLDNEHAIVVEPRMTGLVLLQNAPDEEHLRVGFQLDHPIESWLWFWDRRGLGSVCCWHASQVAELSGENGLGPDALQVVPSFWRARMATVRRAIKVALLDQQMVAGIGNLYASEILHVARIHPSVACNHLGSQDWRRLHRAVHEVLEEAIKHEGSTLSDGTYRNALNGKGSYQNHHRVYARAGQTCPTCRRTSIVRIVQSQRSTFFCPECQPERRVRRAIA